MIGDWNKTYLQHSVTIEIRSIRFSFVIR